MADEQYRLPPGPWRLRLQYLIEAGDGTGGKG